MYSWLMDDGLCRLILKNVLEERCAGIMRIYTKTQQRGVIAQAALEITGANSLTHCFVYRWVRRLCEVR